MENGDSLFGGGWYKEMVIVPDPGNALRYYLFHTGVTYYTKLYYSIIDLTYNGGLGKAIQKNVLADSLPDLGLTDGLTAIKHGNGRDWWVVFRTIRDGGRVNDNTFVRFLVTTTGISQPIYQNIGFLTYTNSLNIYFNHRGDKLVLIDVLGLIELYDFDRCSGQLSNLRTIQAENTNPNTFYRNFNWSAEFSPNDSILYVSTNDPTVSYLYQFDLFAPSISLSKVLLDSITAPGSGGDLKLAPDNKIYWAGGPYDGFHFPFPYPDSVYNQYNMNLSFISQPNVYGLGCDFQRYAFSLGRYRTYWGLPNNPNYDMLAAGGTICDTLGLPNALNEYSNYHGISLYPNPFQDRFHIQFKSFESAEVYVYNSVGQMVLHSSLSSSSTEIDLAQVPEGYYLIKIRTNSGTFQKRIMKLN